MKGIFILYLVISSFQAFFAEIVTPRIAFIVTIAGPRKLADYFEWSCRSIANSKDIADLIVFHENNQKLNNITCAENVKFVNLGANGLSQIIANHLLGTNSSEKSVVDVSFVLQNVLIKHPKYLVEVKPLFGTLFKNYLTSYSHWTYTDPDIIWGNLTTWLEPKDLEDFDYISYAKIWDAARLFLRGQITIHKNTEKINNLWRKLDYFKPEIVASRLGTALHMLASNAPSDTVFRSNFYSAEGLYSQLVFKSKTKVKIIGRGFDDFLREPVILNNGMLTRCPLTGNLKDCVNLAVNSSVSDIQFSIPTYIPAKAFYDKMTCKMFWLPFEARYCIASEHYNKQKDINSGDHPEVKIERVGEVILDQGNWLVNDEMKSNRQILDKAAFFHFRHWDDFVAKSHVTNWVQNSHNLGCMVLYLRKDQAMVFETCQDFLITSSMSDLIIIHPQSNSNGRVYHNMEELLSSYRKELEAGKPQNFANTFGGNHHKKHRDHHKNHEGKHRRSKE